MESISFKVYSKVNADLVLTIRDGKAILAKLDPSNLYQDWYKYYKKHSAEMKAEEESPCFALVNTATGHAVKHIGERQPVELIPYNSDTLEQSNLWTESKDLGDYYKAIIRVNNINLSLDAFYDGSSFHDGTIIGVFDSHNKDNQQWKFVLEYKPSFKVYSKGNPDLVLTIKDGKVILARSDPSDFYQNWYKVENYNSTKLIDEEGCPGFVLVNKATGQAIKQIGDSQPVELMPYNSDGLYISILWTESTNLGDGYRAIRTGNNIHINLDAYGFADGTTIGLWKSHNKVNQQWKFVPQYKPSFRIYSKVNSNLVLTIRDGKVILARSDPSDLYQNWYKDENYNITKLTDEEGCPGFILVNKATGQAIKQIGESQLVELIPYINPNGLCISMFWSESMDLGDGYRAIRMVNNIQVNLDAFADGGFRDGTTVGLWKSHNKVNQQWKFIS